MAQPPLGDPLAGLFGLLVGHQWPGQAALASTLSASATRSANGAGHEDYADLLQSIRGLALQSQRGVTAEDIGASFGAGETHIREIAARNRAKAGAYDAAHRSASQLRADLTDIARRGEADIREIVRSAAPVEQQISAVAEVVARCQGLANGKAAQQAGSILDAIQNVLDAQGSAVSARQLVRQGGVDLHTAFASRSPDEIRRQVTGLLESSATATAPPGAVEAPATAAPGAVEAPATAAPGAVEAPATAAPGAVEAPATTAPGAVEAEPPVSPGSATGIGGAGSSGPPVPATGAGAHAADASARTPAPPQHPAADLPTGRRSGASEFGHLPSASLFPGAPSAPTPWLGTEHAGAAEPADTAPTPAVVAAQPAVAAISPLTHTPVVPAPAANTAAAAPAATAPRPLLAYGADIRPPGLGAPPVTAAVPAGAPVGPTGVPGPAGQYAVARRTTAVASGAAASAAGPGQRAAAAATRTTGIGRLHRLLTAVARQKPELRWAIGDLEDGTTLLVTDLACGWIPPGVRIPTGVRLLQPAARPGDLAALLGAGVLTAVYRPCPNPAAVDGEVPVSAGAYETVPVDDLAWELTRATRCRDGLPRLAHTLARAASSGTGVLDSEVALLRRHLDATGGAVLDSYPAALDQDRVGDWQLLAAVDALVRERITTANYHFAWFLALTRAARR